MAQSLEGRHREIDYVIRNVDDLASQVGSTQEENAATIPNGEITKSALAKTNEIINEAQLTSPRTTATQAVINSFRSFGCAISEQVREIVGGINRDQKMVARAILEERGASPRGLGRTARQI